MELVSDGGTKVCSNGPGHMTKMAAMPIYGKNLLWNQKANDLETRYAASGARVLPFFFPNYDPGFTLTYFTARSNLVPRVLFLWEKNKTMDISETIVVYDVKFGRCS